MVSIRALFGMLAGALVLLGCSKEEDVAISTPNDPVSPQIPTTPTEFDINSITDTYYHLANAQTVWQWGYQNVHDPSIFKVGDTYYCYSTDVCFGCDIRPGVQIRKSTDLIKWEFVGWVFNGLPTPAKDFIVQNGGTPNNSFWAPFVLKHGNTYRLYYSLASNGFRVSVIGLATASNPAGPWTDQGIVVTSTGANYVGTNAIDPSVITDSNGNQWMYYGSSWDAIYKVRLNPATGKTQSSGDRGVRVAHRGFTGDVINGNIEAPEIVYHPGFNKYYLFLAYDWLQTKYNVRVGRSDNPDGPFYDFDGQDMNTLADNGPMILAPYRFQGHSGWQGVSHCGVFTDDNGQFFMAHQGRPGENSFFMDLHIRKMHWTQDGWPVVSPERYAGVEQTPIALDEIAGTYEQIVLNYQVVPGFAETQTQADFQNSTTITLDPSGSINGNSANSWEYLEGKLLLNFGGENTIELILERGRDWENRIASTLLFTGLNQSGKAVWGKKIQ